MVGGLTMARGIVVKDLNQNKDLRDKAFSRSDPIDWGTIGATPRFDYAGDPRRKNPAQDSQMDSPEWRNFTRDKGFQDSWPLAEEKLFRLSQTYDVPEFEHPIHNDEASYWVNNYRIGAQRGLIAFEDEVGPWSLEFLVQQPANSGASTMNPNEANKFPSQGIEV
mgnify:CR=1 FL=1